MLHTVKTQEGSFVNLDNILQIVPQILDFGDVTAYVLTAQPISVNQINDETLDDCIQLCIYDSYEKMTAAFLSFSKWLEGSRQTIFAFPADLAEPNVPAHSKEQFARKEYGTQTMNRLKRINRMCI